MTPRTEPFGFVIIQFLFWSALVTFEAFMVPYLRTHGYTPAEIGPIMGAVFGLAVVGQPLLGAIVDHVASPKRFIAGALVVAASVVLAIPAVVASYAAVLVIVLVYSMSANSLPAVLDGWIMARREDNPRVNYGIARGFGSAGFAAGGVTIGFAADRFGTSIIFPIYFAIILVTVGFVLQIPSVRRHPDAGAAAAVDPPADPATADPATAAPANADPATAAPANADPATAAPGGGGGSSRRGASRLVRENVTAVVTNGPYIALLVSAYLAFVGLRAALTFLPILVEELNGSVSDVGLAHSIAAMSEIPFFFLSGLILFRVRGPRLVAALLGVLALRLFGYTLLATTAQLFVLQLSHGLTFGLFLAATVDYIHRIAPPRHRSFFQALAPSVYFGLGSITGSWLGGVIIERFSTTVMYRSAAVTALVGALLLFAVTLLNGYRGRGDRRHVRIMDPRQSPPRRSRDGTL